MRNKRLFACILTAVVSLCSVSACGENASSENTSPTPTESTVEITPVPDNNPSDADSEVVATSGIKIEHIRDLSNPNATAKAQLIYDYLCSVPGKGIISGQEESCGAQSANNEINYIKKLTGAYPALRGLDYINDDFEGVNNRAIFWANKMKGLVTIGWHWGAPPNGIGYEDAKGKVDMNELLTEGSDLYNAMIAQMDTAAEYLKQLQDENVVVLWRPFHEFDGQWFWWGKGGADSFIKLWKLMYDRYTNYHGLNNLIWVLGYSSKMQKGWYPGDEYVDIIGGDDYNMKGARPALYNLCLEYGAEGMPCAMHECGTIPKPSELQEKQANWIWFMAWTMSNLKEGNTADDITQIYTDDYVINQEDLPDFDALLEQMQ